MNALLLPGSIPARAVTALQTAGRELATVELLELLEQQHVDVLEQAMVPSVNVGLVKVRKFGSISFWSVAAAESGEAAPCT